MTERPRTRPCPSCPYRRGCPSGIWDASEYTKLPTYDGDIGDQAQAGAFGLFACHATPDALCSGWLGHRHPDELLAVRIALADGRVDEAIMEYLDPDNWALCDDGEGGPLPGCPVCATPVVVDRIEVTTRMSLEPEFIDGRWECPNDCNPYRSDPRYTSPWP